MNVLENNRLFLELISYYLNNHETLITKKDIDEVMSCGVDETTAYRLLLSSFLNIDNNQELNNLYLRKSLKLLNEEDYINDEYYKNIHINNIKYKDWEIKNTIYKPYELFVYDDFLYEGLYTIPRLGFFNKEYNYLGVYNKDRLWMSLTPNEINTMKEPINNAHGKVLTLGLGLGYYTYMVSNKDNVESITVVELDKDIIDLFNNKIINNFKNKDKINIINIDQYEFINNLSDSLYDYIFIDTYHDAGDGLLTYNNLIKKLKTFKKTKYNFWIEKTIKYYL